MNTCDEINMKSNVNKNLKYYLNKTNFSENYNVVYKIR